MKTDFFYSFANIFSSYGVLTVWDIILFPVYFYIIFLLAKRTINNKISNNPEYQYYWYGLLVKIIGVIGFSIIYIYYYNGGDTIIYYQNSEGLINILFDKPSTFFSIMTGHFSKENFAIFSKYTYRLFYWRDPQAFWVIRFITPFVFLGMKCYLLTSIIMAYITFSGVWKLYLVFIEHFPDMKKELAIAILFMPSVCFWGSGILKDSITLASAGWFVFGVYNIFIKFNRHKILYFCVIIFISSYLLLSIKPYIFFSLVFGLIVWIAFLRLQAVKSNFHRILIFPTIFLLSWFVGSMVITKTGSLIGGSYENVDKMVNKAEIIRKDLVRTEQYGGNNFDIGTYDPSSFLSVLSKVPQAIVAGLYRPFLWETRNIVMLMSGLENLVIMIFTLFVIFRKGPLFLLNTLFDNPLILFSFVFAIVFAFSIGFSTSNFGALVRYKIPLIPFFMAALFFVRRKQINLSYIELEKKNIKSNNFEF